MYGELKPRAADEVQAGSAFGHTAGGGLRGLGERATFPEVGVVGLLGTAIHHNDLALGCLQAGHGALVGLVALGAEPFARV